MSVIPGCRDATRGNRPNFIFGFNPSTRPLQPQADIPCQETPGAAGKRGEVPPFPRSASFFLKDGVIVMRIGTPASRQRMSFHCFGTPFPRFGSASCCASPLVLCEGQAFPCNGQAALREGQAAARQGQVVLCQRQAAPRHGQTVLCQRQVAFRQGQAVPSKGQVAPGQGQAFRAEGQSVRCVAKGVARFVETVRFLRVLFGKSAAHSLV